MKAQKLKWKFSGLKREFCWVQFKDGFRLEVSNSNNEFSWTVFGFIHETYTVYNVSGKVKSRVVAQKLALRHYQNLLKGLIVVTEKSEEITDL